MGRQRQNTPQSFHSSENNQLSRALPGEPELTAFALLIEKPLTKAQPRDIGQSELAMSIQHNLLVPFQRTIVVSERVS